MPAIPRAGFVVVEAELILGGFEAVFDRPATAFDGDESLDACSGRAPCREIGEIAVADIAADQQASRPKPRFRLIILISFEIGEFTISPVMKPGALGALASGQALPGNWFKLSRDLLGGAGNDRLARRGTEVVIRFNPQNIAFAGSAKRQFDVPDTIHGICCDPRERHFGGQRTLYHLNGERWLGGEGHSVRNMGCRKPRRIAGPALGQIQSAIDKSMPTSRHIGGEHANLAVRYLAGRTGILTCDATRRFALFEETGLIDNQNRVICGEVLGNILSRKAAQPIRVPAPTAQNGLPPPGARVSGGFRTHQPVLRRSSPSSPSKNRFADAATRSCVNSSRIRPFTSRSDDAHSSSVVSIDAPVIHGLPTIETY